MAGLVISQNEGQNNEDLLMWITEPGTEYYMHMYLWRNIPFSFKLNAMTEAVDITVRMISTFKDTNCNSEDNYNYIGRINIPRVGDMIDILFDPGNPSIAGLDSTKKIQ